MSSPGKRDRAIRAENMRKIEVGAKISRLGGPESAAPKVWTIVRTQYVDCGAWLTLQLGKRRTRVHVSFWALGPHLARSGLASVALPPTQRELIAIGAGKDEGFGYE